jgi:hypothetical protein
MISAIDLALNLLQGILASASIKGLAPEIVKDIEAAVAALAKVQGTPVTYGQLEGLRVKAEW